MKYCFYLHDSNKTNVACEYPNKCPICNNGITPDNISNYFNQQQQIVYIFFYCPSCGKCFISNYNFTGSDEIINNYTWHQISLINSYPTIPSQIDFESYIKDLSPTFCDIYNQANSAEVYGLNQIAGMGYRKALEFLIKDYCIYKHPDKAEKIKSQLLGQVINDYVAGDKIKALSKVSAWIGNDETHYIRKFENKDITDLKRFITATVAFITYDLTSDEADELIS